MRATQLGVDGYDELLGDYTAAGFERRERADDAMVDATRDVDETPLSLDQRLDLGLFARRSRAARSPAVGRVGDATPACIRASACKACSRCSCIACTPNPTSRDSPSLACEALPEVLDAGAPTSTRRSSRRCSSSAPPGRAAPASATSATSCRPRSPTRSCGPKSPRPATRRPRALEGTSRGSTNWRRRRRATGCSASSGTAPCSNRRRCSATAPPACTSAASMPSRRSRRNSSAARSDRPVVGLAHDQQERSPSITRRRPTRCASPTRRAPPRRGTFLIDHGPRHVGRRRGVPGRSVAAVPASDPRRGVLRHSPGVQADADRPLLRAVPARRNERARSAATPGVEQLPLDPDHHRARGVPRTPLAPHVDAGQPATAAQDRHDAVLLGGLGPVRRARHVRARILRDQRGDSRSPRRPHLPRGAHRGRHRAAHRRDDSRTSRRAHDVEHRAVGGDGQGRSAAATARGRRRRRHTSPAASRSNASAGGSSTASAARCSTSTTSWPAPARCPSASPNKP